MHRHNMNRHRMEAKHSAKHKVQCVNCASDWRSSDGKYGQPYYTLKIDSVDNNGCLKPNAACECNNGYRVH